MGTSYTFESFMVLTIQLHDLVSSGPDRSGPSGAIELQDRWTVES